MYMQAGFKKAQRLHISLRYGPGHVGSPSFLWHRVTLWIHVHACSATSTTPCSAKRTTLCFCTAFRDILSTNAHAFRFAWLPMNMCCVTSTTLCFTKRTILWFCTAFRDILSADAHAFRFAWFACHHSQNPWFSLRHGQYTLIFRFYSIFSLADTQNTFSFTKKHQEELILSSLDHCFPAEVFFTQLSSKVHCITPLLHTT